MDRMNPLALVMARLVLDGDPVSACALADLLRESVPEQPPNEVELAYTVKNYSNAETAETDVILAPVRVTMRKFRSLLTFADGLDTMRQVVSVAVFVFGKPGGISLRTLLWHRIGVDSGLIHTFPLAAPDNPAREQSIRGILDRYLRDVMSGGPFCPSTMPESYKQHLLFALEYLASDSQKCGGDSHIKTLIELAQERKLIEVNKNGE